MMVMSEKFNCTEGFGKILLFTYFMVNFCDDMVLVFCQVSCYQTTRHMHNSCK